jgi:hypothetical protein
MKIFFVRIKVTGQIVNPLGDKRNLNLCFSAIIRGRTIFPDNLRRLLLG